MKSSEINRYPPPAHYYIHIHPFDTLASSRFDFHFWNTSPASTRKWLLHKIKGKSSNHLNFLIEITDQHPVYLNAQRKIPQITASKIKLSAFSLNICIFTFPQYNPHKFEDRSKWDSQFWKKIGLSKNLILSTFLDRQASHRIVFSKS